MTQLTHALLPHTVGIFLPKSIPSSSTWFLLQSTGDSRGNSASRTQQGQVKESQINLNKYYRFFSPGRGADFPRTIHHGPSELENPKMRERKREPQRETRKLSNRPSSFPFLLSPHLHQLRSPPIFPSCMPASYYVYCELGAPYCHTMIWEQSEGIPFSLARSSSTTS
jgi:hypothetical protein